MQDSQGNELEVGDRVFVEGVGTADYAGDGGAGEGNCYVAQATAVLVKTVAIRNVTRSR